MTNNNFRTVYVLMYLPRYNARSICAVARKFNAITLQIDSKNLMESYYNALERLMSHHFRCNMAEFYRDYYSASEAQKAAYNTYKQKCAERSRLQQEQMQIAQSMSDEDYEWYQIGQMYGIEILPA